MAVPSGYSAGRFWREVYYVGLCRRESRAFRLCRKINLPGYLRHPAWRYLHYLTGVVAEESANRNARRLTPENLQ